MLHGDKTNGNATNGHDDIFYQIADHYTVHSAEYGIKHGKQGEYDPIKMCDILSRNIKWNIWSNEIPRNKNFNEFSQSNEAIGKKTKATDQGKNYGNVM